MDWSEHLAPGEKLLWEARPAPRCYTFRNWRHSLFGVLLLVIAVWWQAVGLQLSEAYSLPLLAWVPLPFLLLGLFLALGHLLLARWEWERVFYAVTDRRVLAQRGLWRRRLENLELAQVTYFQVRPLGEELATVRIRADNAVLALCCIEYPRRLTALLEEAMVRSGTLAGGERV
jgi:hypothetical protein